MDFYIVFSHIRWVSGGKTFVAQYNPGLYWATVVIREGRVEQRVKELGLYVKTRRGREGTVSQGRSTYLKKNILTENDEIFLKGNLLKMISKNIERLLQLDST